MMKTDEITTLINEETRDELHLIFGESEFRVDANLVARHSDLTFAENYILQAIVDNYNICRVYRCEP